MIPRSYLDPLGSRLPALERNILKVRAMQMVLVLFYAEQLKQRVIGMIQGTESLMDRLKPGSVPLRVPKGVKNPVDKALSALLADGAITADDKIEIIKLIDFRNIIGHDVHELVGDLSSDRYAREIAAFSPDRLAQYDYHAVGRLRHFHALFDDLNRTHHYVTTLRMDGLMFRSSEKTLLAEIDTLMSKLERLHRERRRKVKALNAEMKLYADAPDEEHPDHPLNRYDNGRLTRRGEEICYRLFDRDKSPMAVAHLMRISPPAASKRKRQWLALGGKRRPKVDVRTRPKRKFYRRDDG
jgi:hypothetical protein